MPTIPDESERRWLADKIENGWSFPPKAPWPLRLPVARHVRAAWHTYRAERQAYAFASAGIGLGHVNQYDRWVIYAIARGWC